MTRPYSAEVATFMEKLKRAPFGNPYRRELPTLYVDRCGEASFRDPRPRPEHGSREEAAEWIARRGSRR
jgi:hypothetical protein